jgi:mannose/fructose/N-acetylgalactosamine-specific phosphotransferase system component IIB
MFSYNIIIVNDHVESLLAEAAEQRLAKQAAKPGIRARVSSIAAAIKSTLTAPADVGSMAPRLSGYPYES